MSKARDNVIKLNGLPIDVKEYGAKGDGVTDDTAAIHLARDAAGVGGTVYYPEGTYMCAGVALNVANQAHVFANDAKLKLVSGSINALIRISASYVKIQNLEADGNKANCPTGGGIVISATGNAGATGLGPVGVELDFRDFYDHDTFGVFGVNIADWRFTGKIRNCTQIQVFVSMNADHGDLKGGYADLDINFENVDTAGYIVRGREVAAPGTRFYYGGQTNGIIRAYDNPPATTSNCLEHRCIRDWSFDCQTFGGAMGYSFDSVLGTSGGRLLAKSPNAWGLEIQQTYGCGELHFWGAIDMSDADGDPRGLAAMLIGFGDSEGSIQWDGPLKGCKGDGNTGRLVFINQSNTKVTVNGSFDIRGAEFACYAAVGSNVGLNGIFRGGPGVLGLLRTVDSAGRFDVRGRLEGPVATSLGDVGTTTLKTDDINFAVDVEYIPAATVTMTIASPAVATLTDHRMFSGQSFRLTTSGALPTGVATGTTYYVLADGLTSNTFRFSATPNGAAVNTSGSQSGTHTLTTYPNIVPAFVVAASGSGSIGDALRVSTAIPLTASTFGYIDNWKTKVIRAYGAGTPEAALTAGVGSTFARTDGGAATTLYIKESGTGNTGWVGK
jgi:hypothetical protein